MCVRVAQQSPGSNRVVQLANTVQHSAVTSSISSVPAPRTLRRNRKLLLYLDMSLLSSALPAEAELKVSAEVAKVFVQKKIL